MILKASLFRLSNFAYETATKKKLNLFIGKHLYLVKVNNNRNFISYMLDEDDFLPTSMYYYD